MCALAAAALATLRRARKTRADSRWALVAAAIVLAAICGFSARHYFLPHKYLVGAKYDQVMVGPKKLDAFAYLATLPDAKTTTIGDGNVDGSGWMYAVAGLHPLWTHYDFPQQQGPGYHRYIFWAYADDADTDRRVTEAVHALNIRYVITSTPVVQGFKVPDGLRSLDISRSWRKLYDNGAAQIYEWVGDRKPDAEGDK
ncbi:conserved transmembrane protein [Mycobacteroides abscessus subsp. massiliense]|nr:conserved transmembrane protein [Mycobacteroides abscessus subsp. massiliense]